MSFDVRLSLVRLILRAGRDLEVGPKSELDQISNELAENISPGQLRLLANIAERVGRLLREEARTIEAAAA